MSEEKKTHKRKGLTRWLILAACILLIAAVTVTVVFAANNWFRNDITLETDDGKNPSKDDGKPSQGDDKPSQGDDKPSQGDKPTTSVTEFVSPVTAVDVVNSFDFGKDVTLGHYHFHTGLDMAGEVGAEVVSCLDGTVESVVKDDQLDGTTVTIVHANGIKTVYSYINAAEKLKAGDKVTRGQVIGTIAEANGAEYLQGAHLHFEVYKNDELCDPEEFLDVAAK